MPNSPDIGTLRVANTDVSVEQDGVTCNFTLDPGTAQYTSLGGNGQVTLLATDAACPWTATSLSPWITLTASPACPPGAPIGCAHGGTGNGTVSYVVDVNENVARTGDINIAQSLFGIDQLGFFFDDFDNGVVSPFWTNDPASGWTEMNSRLIGDFATGETGTTIARPAFAGCIECEISAKLRFDRFSQGSASVLAWYLDEFTHVELEANEFRNQWELRQVVNGVVVASSGVLSRPTVTGVDYTVELVFNGTEIALSIDGDLALLMPPAVGTTPDGTVGFKVTNNLVSFDLVKAVTGTESVALPRDVFADGFE